jgi:hypothetical protein
MAVSGWRTGRDKERAELRTAWRAELRAELMMEEGWQETFLPNLRLNLGTRTRYPTAET